ncbi:MAG: PIG-L family deacetylase [Candidatus Heimdallarchaeota archaeon]|nr:PIG-L family deacetylase [Candidatus Heimdallarchaeota archaeon]MCK5047923.1 PIG-L family deacetylase [Candidatus Heimdallarchaeota archaeon]
MRVMSILAHPDDEAFSCGGTLVKHAKNGDETFIVTLTMDDVRKEEFVQAGKILGAEPISLDYSLITPNNQREIREKLIRIIRAKKPDTVITHVEYDYHLEHRLCRDIVLDAIEWASHFTYDKETESHQVKTIYAVETTVLIPYPEFLVDISDVLETKRKACEVYKSQTRKLNSSFYSDFHITRTKLRGIQARTVHAEAFEQVKQVFTGSFKKLGSVDTLPSL